MEHAVDVEKETVQQRLITFARARRCAGVMSFRKLSLKAMW